MKVACFFIIYYHIQLQDPLLSGTSITPTIEVYMSAMLLLLIAGN